MTVSFGPPLAISAAGATVTVLFPEADPGPLEVEVEVRTVRGVPQVVGLALRQPSWERIAESPLSGVPEEHRAAMRDALRAAAQLQSLPQEELDQPVRSGEVPVRAFADREPFRVTSDLLRAIPLRELRQAALAYMAGEGDAFAILGQPRRVGRERKDRAFFAEVAAVYEQAVVERGEPPLQAIAHHFGVSWDTAKSYARRARQRGLLGYPEKRGVAGAAAPESPWQERGKS